MQLDSIETNLREAIVEGGPVADGVLTNPARLDIHRTHFATTLTRALESVFPAVVSLVDKRFFAYCADTYIRENPPPAPCLFEYGATFPDFLSAFPPCAGLPYLADVARLEWLMHEAFHAPDEDKRVLESAFPVHLIWRAALDPEAPSVDLNQGGTKLAVYRAHDDVAVEEYTDPT